MQSRTLSLHLKVLSPLHIGCGEVYEPTSFVVKREKNVLVSFNTLHFLAGLDDKLLGEFSAICKKGTSASLLEVYNFIDRHAQDMDGLTVELTPALVEHYQKVLNLSENKIKNELNQFSLFRTAFNALDSSVYIPGSAIKGSIRTAVLNLRHATHYQSDLQKQQLNIPQNDKNATQILEKLEEELLGGDFKDSPFSLLKVSDFHLVSPVRRRIVYAVYKKKNPNNSPPQKLHQIVEIIEPGAVFAGTLTLLPPPDNSPVLPEKALRLDEVENALQTFYGKELERERGEAAAIPTARYPVFTDDVLPLRIGRHSGAECVTVEGQRIIKILKKNQRPEYRANATTIWFAAENKEGKGELRPFGWVALQEIRAEEIAKQKEQQRLTEEHRAEEEKKRQAEEARLAAMSPEEREIEAVASLQAKEDNAVALYNKLDALGEALRNRAAQALQAFWQNTSKWEGKSLSKKQAEKVKKVKSLLVKEA